MAIEPVSQIAVIVYQTLPLGSKFSRKVLHGNHTLTPVKSLIVNLTFVAFRAICCPDVTTISDTVSFIKYCSSINDAYELSEVRRHDAMVRVKQQQSDNPNVSSHNYNRMTSIEASVIREDFLTLATTSLHI